MPVYLLGEGSASVPFNRTFFNVTLGDLLKTAGGSESVRFTLYLTDGMRLAVCKIEELADPYMIVRGYSGEDEACDTTLHVVPYGLIYRMEIDPKGMEESTRLGFTWTTAEGTEAS